MMSFCPDRQRSTDPISISIIDLHPLSPCHSAGNRDPFGGEISGPTIGRSAVRVGLCYPASCLQKQIAAPFTAVLLNRGCRKPALDIVDPNRIDAIPRITESSVAVFPVNRLRNRAKVLQGL